MTGYSTPALAFGLGTILTELILSTVAVKVTHTVMPLMDFLWLVAPGAFLFAILGGAAFGFGLRVARFTACRPFRALLAGVVLCTLAQIVPLLLGIGLSPRVTLYLVIIQTAFVAAAFLLARWGSRVIAF
jgi:hypothetical protein